jgi:DNA primase
MLEPKDEIRQKLDVAEVLGEYLTMKPAGSGSFKAVCPFHSERTPSFHISHERQIWHCFGCDKGGDIFAFVMEMEGMTFPEAVRHLGKKAGVEVPEFHPVSQATVDAKTALLAIHETAQKYYAAVLTASLEAAGARDYLAKRGITADLIEKFGLGYAPDRWDSLATALTKRGYTAKAIMESGLGLAKKSGGGTIDRFRHRIMIPLHDPVGQVVGFTGRILDGGKTTSSEAPKYMNSPESHIYHKGEVLYGLHLAKTGMKMAGSVIIVEGNLDVVASHKAGVENIVASSGTALTEAQLRILSRYTKTLIFALDGDAAGIAAAKRVFDLALRLQKSESNALLVALRCLLIPPEHGKDPDEVVQKSPELWQQIVSESREIVEFFFDHTIRAFELRGSSSIEDRKKLIAELIPEVARLTRADERHLYLLRIADATHVDLPVLTGMMPATANQPVVTRKASTAGPKQQRDAKSAEFIVSLMLADDSVVPEIVERLPINIVLPEPWNKLYIDALRLYTAPQNSGAINKSLFARQVGEYHEQGAEADVNLLEATLIRFEEQVRTLTPAMVRAELDLHIAFFQGAAADNRRKTLESAIREAELRGDAVTLQALLTEYTQLIRHG